MNLRRAQKMLAQARFDEAETALNTRETAGYSPRRAFVLARIHQARGDMARAVEDLEEARRRLPDYAPAHLFYGISMLDLDENMTAADSFSRTLELQPYNILAKSYLALANLKSGNDAQGLEIYLKNGFSDNRWFLVRLTEWMELQWLENGRFFYERDLPKLKETPRRGFVGNFFGHRRAEKYFFSKKYPELLSELACFAEGESFDEEAAFACAFASEMLFSYSRALEFASRFPEGEGLPDTVRALRARNSMRLGKFAQAANDLNQVLIIGPEDYGANYYLAVLCLSHGERAKARNLFFRAFSDFLVDTLEYQFWQIQRALLESLEDRQSQIPA